MVRTWGVAVGRRYGQSGNGLRRGTELEGTAPVEDQGLAGQEIGGEEVDDGVGDVFGATGAAEGGAADEIGLEFGRVAGHGDGAGSDGVDAHFGGEFPGEAASHLNDAGFGDGVRDVAAPGLEGSDIGEVDDAAGTRLGEVRRGGLREKEWSAEVGVERVFPGFFGDGAEFGFEEIGGAIDEDIEAAEVFGDGIDDERNGGEVGEV